MRELLFRAWRNGVMIGPETLEGMLAVASKTGYSEEYVSEVIWLQFTGAEDEFGDKIYEGHILAFGDDCLPERLGMYGVLGVVRYSDNDARFYVELTDGRNVRFDDHNTFSDYKTCRKIMGNIHENPELLTN